MVNCKCQIIDSVTVARVRRGRVVVTQSGRLGLRVNLPDSDLQLELGKLLVLGLRRARARATVTEQSQRSALAIAHWASKLLRLGSRARLSAAGLQLEVPGRPPGRASQCSASARPAPALQPAAGSAQAKAGPPAGRHTALCGSASNLASYWLSHRDWLCPRAACELCAKPGSPAPPQALEQLRIFNPFHWSATELARTSKIFL